MGLDQYWFSKIADNNEGEPQYEEIYYHRKFNALEGFMAAQWAEETGRPAQEFNCHYFTVTPAVLDKLEEAIRNDKLDPVGGFFFGSTEKDEYYQEDVKELAEIVIPKIREYLQKGETVVYTSWW